MSLDVSHANAAPLTSIEQLVDTFRAAEKPISAHRLGLEHEKFIYPKGQVTPVVYEGPQGIGALLEKLAGPGDVLFREAPGRPVIALQNGPRTVTLEPGGQLEHAGSPFGTAREADVENRAHLQALRTATHRLGLRVVAMGYRPFGAREAVGWMPKTRYVAMRSTLGARGPLALNMMLMTATSQVSLDWASEADCARKMTLAARTAPLLMALYANSALVEGKPSGFKSFRSHVWTQVDAARCGFIPAMLDGHFTYRAYVDWALSAPVLFLRRRGEYLTPKVTFGELLRQGFEGKPITDEDWADHLSTLFPEVRLKRVLEIRSADCGDAEMTGALAALMRGLLYDPTALDEALALLPAPVFDAHLAFMETARREALAGRYAGRTLAGWTSDLVAIAKRGLSRLDPLDVPLLEPLQRRAHEGLTPADETLSLWKASALPSAILSASEV